MIVNSPAPCKRRRFSNTEYFGMDLDTAKAIFESSKQKYGREIRVFETFSAYATSVELSNDEETDDFYDFTAEDYFRILATKKDEKFLKTRKIREVEEAAHKSIATKAVVRVRFPDNNTLEASFDPLEPIQHLVDLLMKVVSHPELPFYIFTTPPKKKIKDMSHDFYSAGFVPGVIIYFSYDLPNGDDDGRLGSWYLQEEILCLKGLNLELYGKQQQVKEIAPEDHNKPPVAANKIVKPKWLKM